MCDWDRRSEKAGPKANTGESFQRKRGLERHRPVPSWMFTRVAPPFTAAEHRKAGPRVAGI